VAGILFDFGFVEENRQVVLAAIEALAGHMEDIDALVRRLSQSWAGAAAEAFKVKHAEWQQTAAAIHDDLRYIHDMVCNSQNNFASAHAAVQTLWGEGE
jgi:WXG100 family type VII secretion target